MHKISLFYFDFTFSFATFYMDFTYKIKINFTFFVFFPPMVYINRLSIF